MSIDASIAELWESDMQSFRNAMQISVRTANTKMEKKLSSGDTVHFTYWTDLRGQSYADGTDATIDELTDTDDSLIIDQQHVATFPIDPVKVKQSSVPFRSAMTKQGGNRLSNYVDQYIMNLHDNNAAGIVSGGALGGSSVYAAMTQASAKLKWQRAGEGAEFIVIDPTMGAYLEESFVSNGYKASDLTLRNGFRGRVNGFDTYISTNIPNSVALGLATNPTAADYITLYGVTFTFVVTPSNPGEVDIGANAAATQANLLLAINGTGTPGVTTYIEVSTDDRRALQNAQVNCPTFASDSSTITGYGAPFIAEDLSAGADGFGTPSSSMLAGKYGAVSLAMQMSPKMYMRPEGKQIRDNAIIHQLFGAKVFERDKARLVKITHNSQ